ncbi:MAG: hypothetical protein JHC93_02710 [Parachlamydiales bacterium]|nr:hypothetical protein [Parachlamydiales bacterium]
MSQDKIDANSSITPSQLPPQAQATQADEHAKKMSTKEVQDAVTGDNILNYVIQALTVLELANNLQVSQYNQMQQLSNDTISSYANLMTKSGLQIQELPSMGKQSYNKYITSSAYRNVVKHNADVNNVQSMIQASIQVNTTTGSLYQSSASSTTSMIGQLMEEVSSFISTALSVLTRIFPSS